MGYIQTVHGAIDPVDLGMTLMHEHLVTDLRPEWERIPPTPPLMDAMDDIAAHMRELVGLGVKTLVECTPTVMGHDLEAYRALSSASGLTVVAATGSYRDAWLPDWLRSADVAAIAAWYEREVREERAGFIKIGCDPTGPTEAETQCARAAGSASRATGALTACHVGRGMAAHQVLDAFEDGGGDPARFVVVHLQNEPDVAIHRALARRGAWVEFDGIGAAPCDDEYVRWIAMLAEAGLFGRVLISQDACAYIVGADGVATQERRFGHLITTFVPTLLAAGFTESDVERLLIEHPRVALTIAG